MDDLRLKMIKKKNHSFLLRANKDERKEKKGGSMSNLKCG